MGNNCFEIRLRNAEGVPVVHLGGAVTMTAMKAIKSVINTLAEAGHYQIIINIERVQPSNWIFFTDLADSIRNIRAHYGAVDIVAAKSRIEQLMQIEQLGQLFRLCESERQAISLIKGLQRQPDRVSTTSARILEQL